LVESHNFEYFKRIGFHLRNAAPIVATRVNPYTRHAGLSQRASVTNMESFLARFKVFKTVKFTMLIVPKSSLSPQF